MTRVVPEVSVRGAAGVPHHVQSIFPHEDVLFLEVLDEVRHEVKAATTVAGEREGLSFSVERLLDGGGVAVLDRPGVVGGAVEELEAFLRSPGLLRVASLFVLVAPNSSAPARKHKFTV